MQLLLLHHCAQLKPTTSGKRLSPFADEPQRTRVSQYIGSHRFLECPPQIKKLIVGMMKKNIQLLVAFHQFRMVLSPYIKVKFLGDPFLKTLSI